MVKQQAAVLLFLTMMQQKLGGCHGGFFALLLRRRHAGAATRLFSAIVHTEPTFTKTLRIPSIQDMEDIGALLASSWLATTNNNGDNDTTSQHQLYPTTVFLQGDLGAGKTALARGFVQGATGDDSVRVTSPTYLLSNTFVVLPEQVEIHHMDLYRLSGERLEEFQPLNLSHVFANCISLIEWPVRLYPHLSFFVLPENRLVIDLRISAESDQDASEDSCPRILSLEAYGSRWHEILDQTVREGYLDDLLVEETIE